MGELKQLVSHLEQADLPAGATPAAPSPTTTNGAE
jgi:hypothetical protein